MHSTPVRRGAVGAAVGTVWLAGLYVAAPLVGGFAPVALAEAIIVRSPGWLSTLAVGLLGFSAKPVLLGSVLVGIAALSAVARIVWPRVRPETPLLAGVLGVGATAAVFLAAGAPPSPGAVLGVAVAVTPPYLADRLLSTARTSSEPDRRRFLRRVGSVALVGTGSLVGLRAAFDRFAGGSGRGGAGGDVADDVETNDGGADAGGTSQSTAGPGDPRFDFAGMPAAVTPAEDHYVVDINIRPPDVDSDSWSLDVDGAVESPYGLSYDELRAHDASVEQIMTMVCVSNTVGGDLVGTPRWTGVQLSDLVADADPVDGAVDVVTHAADGYSEAVPLDIVEREDILIAYEMGSGPLPTEHGFPARLLVPGRYGMKMTKWITRIEVSTADHEAYWESRGWDEEAVVNTMSYVRGAERDGDRVTVGGVAFGGLETGVEEIAAVEVSVDGGDSWREAELEAPIAPHAWRRWRHAFDAPDRSEFEVVVRAITREGEVQTEERSSPRPSGATGWHRRSIRV
ncbi:molybdopterin-dependent oxidoreductase [Halobellus limi]|uniref:DMSO/TMAO reductase YedYZ, molybdopterin-dependent catalytic subunit n=1 Tax=Halobellus limi TaxID=699433 RepID=A0A1H5WHH4_9EURY|nr:molybdopterin-dependent oxidoreductase [Halobellus limi]QCC46447.1 molybdopterin-binding protein [Halobellus limi]SEF98746.1 DMSO/TMAO reductase YedYZ, molybdopterin-dependent catalytic subunit [Halobellus limi]